MALRIWLSAPNKLPRTTPILLNGRPSGAVKRLNLALIQPCNPWPFRLALYSVETPQNLLLNATETNHDLHMYIEPHIQREQTLASWERHTVELRFNEIWRT